MLALFQGLLGQAPSTHRWRFDRHFAVRLARLDGPRECDLRLPQSDAGLWVPGARRRLVDLVAGRMGDDGRVGCYGWELVSRKRSAEWLENVHRKFNDVPFNVATFIRGFPSLPHLIIFISLMKKMC